MKVLLLIFGSLLAFVAAADDVLVTEYPLHETAFPSNLKDNKALKYFVKLVEENDLNVTVILSSAEHYSNNNLKQGVAMAFTFPVNSVQLKKSKFNKEQGKKFLKTSTDEKLAAKIIHFSDKHKVYTNQDHGVPELLSHRILLHKNALVDFSWDNENYVAQYTFISVGADGKNQTTKVLTADVQPSVIASEGFSESDIKDIRKILAGVLLVYEEDDVPEVLAKFASFILKPKADWNVATHVKPNNYLESDKWVILKALGNTYLLYTA